MFQLEIKTLSKSYSQGEAKIEVLRNLEFRVAPGEIVAVIGPSGSGKSTFLAMTSGMDKPDRGSVYVGSQDITRLNQTELARFRGDNIGIVFQQFHLMANLTAIENVELPLLVAQQKDFSRAHELLERVGLGHRKEHYPSQLSGGENQRVAIARALVRKPKLLLADEPSGNLDTHTGDQVMNLLFDVAREEKMTMILVTHNQELASRCDRRLLLKDGSFEEVKTGGNIGVTSKAHTERV